MVARRPSSAGLTIAARPGTSAVKVRELGLELGANPTAIYRHFLNLDELNSALTDRLTQPVLDQLEGDPADWRDYLTRGAQTMAQVVPDRHHGHSGRSRAGWSQD